MIFILFNVDILTKIRKIFLIIVIYVLVMRGNYYLDGGNGHW